MFVGDMVKMKPSNELTIQFVPNWQDKYLSCYFCETTKSVKYLVEHEGCSFHLCNMCALKLISLS